MKKYALIFAISCFALLGCTQTPMTIDHVKQNDTLCQTGKTLNQEELELPNNTDENQEGMIKITDIFSNDEIDKIRYNFTNILRVDYYFFVLAEDLALLNESQQRQRKIVNRNIEISDKEKSENMDVTYRILSKKMPMFKPVPKDLFEQKMKDVFGVDINNKKWQDSSFYTNHSMYNEFAYTTYIDLKNRIISFGDLPLSFKDEVDWDELEKKLENFDQETLAYYEAKENLYDDFLRKTLKNKDSLYCLKSKIEYLYHCNNYVFYDNQASLSWLLNNTPDGVPHFTNILFEFFNYDKEERINKTKFNFDTSKGFPLNSYKYEHLFAEVGSCAQTDYYNHFQFKVRTGLMQYVVDNCYDETDLDKMGLRKDKLICIMEDCFDFLFEFVLKGDKYKESNQYHYYQTCAYLAYYLQKAYDSYVSHGEGEPRCWHNALVFNLRNDIYKNDSRFEKYVKENNYFNLDGFEEIMINAHEMAIR